MAGSLTGPVAVVIRRLGPGDAHVLETLARDDADFDLDGGPERRTPLSRAASEAHLADPHVLHWTASIDAEVVGSLFCHVLPMRKEPARELLLYEIGVRAAWRRRGIGRALVTAMTDWMRTHDVVTAWVLADNEGAQRFYRASGFAPGSGQAVYLELQIQTLTPRR